MTAFSLPDTILLTAPSGAGKTEALRAFEDLGFVGFSHVLPELATVLIQTYTPYSPRLVLCLEPRTGSIREDLLAVHLELKRLGRSALHVALDCSDEVLLQRYALSRRPHPWFAKTGGMLAAVRAEREALAPAIELAHELIDTSALTPAQLRARLQALVEGTLPELPVTIMSFGFKHGIPADAQFVLDIRFLPNPYYDPQLKALTGRDEPVHRYVFASEQSQQTYRALIEFLRFMLIQYRQDRRSQLLIAIGCTGGQHRSVAFVERLRSDLSLEGFTCTVNHRDLAAQLQELRR